MTPEEALQEAIRITGGLSRLAREVGVSPQALFGWKICPPKRVLAVEAAVKRARSRALTGISRHQLRPDIYP